MKCLFCGAEFETNARNQKYCSLSCQRRAGYRRRHPKCGAEKTCVICGKTFVPKHSTKKYCSKACFLEKVRRKHQGKPLVKKACAICGTEFETNRSNRIYCSARCRHKADNMKPTLYQCVCLRCGATFEAKSRNKTYCSEECKAIARQTAQRRQWWQTKRRASPVVTRKVEPTPEPAPTIEPTPVIEAKPEPPKANPIIIPAAVAENRKPTTDELLDWIFSKRASS